VLKLGNTHEAATRAGLLGLHGGVSGAARRGGGGSGGGGAGGGPPLLFSISHYAGGVRYDARGWREKNADVCEPQHLFLLSSSAHPLAPALLAEHERAASAEGAAAGAAGGAGVVAGGAGSSTPGRHAGTHGREGSAWRRAAAAATGGRRAVAALMGSSHERRRKPTNTLGGAFVRQLADLRCAAAALYTTLPSPL